MLVAALWTILYTHSNRLDLRVFRAALRAKFTRVCFSQLIRLYIFNIVCCVFAANLRWLGVVQFFTMLGFSPLLGLVPVSAFWTVSYYWLLDTLLLFARHCWQNAQDFVLSFVSFIYLQLCRVLAA